MFLDDCATVGSCLIYVFSEMRPELQAILNLLTGSAACCKERGGDGHVGDHVVSVTHPDGRVTSVTVPDKFSPGEETWFKWRKFSESGLN